MTKKEKVIKGLEICAERFCGSDCPYYHRSQMTGGVCSAALMSDALAILKEQEPQLVLNIGEQISCKSGSCPKCGKMLNTTCNKRYCGDCGQEVTWE